MTANPPLSTQLSLARDAHRAMLGELRALVDRLDRTGVVARHEAERTLGAALDARLDVIRLLDAARAGLPDSPAATASELAPIIDAVLTALHEVERTLPQQRLRSLLEELRNGTINAEGRRLRKLTELRALATSELDVALADQANANTPLPGPESADQPWIPWFLQHPSKEREQLAEAVEDARWSRLADFLDLVTLDDWQSSFGYKELPPNPRIERIPHADTAAPSLTQSNPPPRLPAPSLTAALVSELPKIEPRPLTPPAAPALPKSPQAASKILAPAPPTGPSLPPMKPQVEPAAPLQASPSPSATGTPPPKAPTSAHTDLTTNTTTEVLPLPSPLSREEFGAAWWLDPVNTLHRAPWCSPDFAQRLVVEQRDALFRLDEAAALVFAAAGKQLGALDVASTEDVTWLFDFAAGADVPPDGGSYSLRDRVAELVGELRDPNKTPRDAALAVRALLRPGAAQVDTSARHDLLQLIEAEDKHRSLFDTWCDLDHAGVATRSLRDAAANQVATPSELKKELVEAQKSLLERLKVLYKSVGGKVQRTHCRVTWDNFMERAHPQLETLALWQPGTSSPSLPDKRSLLDLRPFAAKLFEKNEAKFGDRRQMDRGVDELLGLAMKVLNCAETLANADSQNGRDHAAFTDGHLKLLPLQGASIRSVLDLALALLDAHSRSSARSTPVISAEVIAMRPLLLDGWSEHGLPNLEADPRHPTSPLVAASHLMADPPDFKDIPWQHWFAARRPERVDGYEDIDPATSELASTASDKARSDLRDLAVALRRQSVDLDHLADSAVSVAREALRIADAEDITIALSREWLRHAHHELQARIDALVEQVRRRALDAGRDPSTVAMIVHQRDYGALVRSPGAEGTRTTDRRTRRATPFRADAASRYRDPRRHLAAWVEARLRDHGQQDLARCWHETANSAASDDPTAEQSVKLREVFLEATFQITPRSLVSKFTKLNPRGGTAYTRAGMDEIARLMMKEVGNPTFLPQLHRYRHLVVKVLPARANHPAIAAKLAREAEDNAITVVLAPGLSRESRDRALDEARPQAKPLAVLDDLDLCRLLDPSFDRLDPMLALFEIVAEQQPWSSFCPYDVVEGQHVRLEMFVGRKDEAEHLVRQPSFSRIFSGRRLGKTALLKFIEGTPEYRTLPSGNHLHVVFCSIAGLMTEAAVARAIVTELRKQADAPELHGEDPVEVMKQMIAQLAESRSTESFLILLDEADAFYEAQYLDKRSESQSTLSWWMSRHAEARVDSRQHPRIRFVFCGYLHTDRNRGVWENKGDVLLLRPLDPQDAESLVAGPLARLGIDASEMAPGIATRCGYQPAAITRFGKELVDHLARRVPQRSGVTPTVTLADVTEVLHVKSVREAIQDSCWLNFVGHPRGQLVFAAMLLALNERSAGTALTDLPAEVLQRVREFVPEFTVRQLTSGTWEDLVNKVLRELEDRSLIERASNTPAAFRLKFPHHLPLLLDPNPRVRIRDAINRVEVDDRHTSWLLDDAQLEEIRFPLLNAHRDLGMRVVFVPTLWPEQLIHPDEGLMPKLRLDDPELKLISGATAENWLIEALGPTSQRRGVVVAGPRAARRALGGGVELAMPGRLSRTQVMSWFQHYRAVEFTGVDSVEALLRTTGGIPLLVAELDRLLLDRHGKGATLDLAALRDLLNRFESTRLHRAASKLGRHGPDGLTQREVELLQLAIAASDELEHDDGLVADGLVEHAFQSDLPHYTPTDRGALRLLVALGLLPRAAQATSSSPLSFVGAVNPADPLRGVVDALVEDMS